MLHAHDVPLFTAIQARLNSQENAHTHAYTHTRETENKKRKNVQQIHKTKQGCPTHTLTHHIRMRTHNTRTMREAKRNVKKIATSTFSFLEFSFLFLSQEDRL